MLCVGVLFLEKKGQEAPPHKEFVLSNLYAGDPFNSSCGSSSCVFFALDLETLCGIFGPEGIQTPVNSEMPPVLLGIP